MQPGLDGLSLPSDRVGTAWCVRLRGEADEAGFRLAARALLLAEVPPERVSWVAGSERDDPVAGLPPPAPDAAPPVVPKAYVALTEWVCLHADPQRHGLLYRLLWRLRHEPALRGDPLDPEWLRATHMAQAVRRALHKTKAFVRFRTVSRPAPEPDLHVAWFDPGHHVVEKVAPFFAARFANVHWTLLTPLRSVSWDGRALQFGEGVGRASAPPADAGEALWLTYYRSIFNPARLKLATMAREMPRRYWTDLPESRLIQPLASAALDREARMIHAMPTTPARRLRPVAPADTDAPPNVDPVPVDPDGAPADERARRLADDRRATAACQRCPLFAGATQAVAGEGPVDAPLMFVGEQPGDREDLTGRPFVGPAGQLFDRVLGELGIARAGVYVTNAVKHFKYELRGTRRIHKSPAQQEVAACVDWLERELALVRPARVVALGATAARALLGRPVAVTRERGQWLTRADGVPVLVTLHPSALLRMPPEEKAEAYRAWKEDLGQVLDRPGR
jgi:DNA polymerase